MDARLKKYWISNDYNEEQINALIFYHPNFSEQSDDGYFYISNTNENVTLKPFGVDKEFIATPFRFTLPTVGEKQQDIKLALPAWGEVDLLQEVENAIQYPNTPIKCLLQIYLKSDDTPMGEFGWFDLDNPSFTDTQVSAVASKKDLFDYYLLYDNRYTNRFSGLVV